MRIVFMGTAPFGIPALRSLLAKQYPVEAVVTAPDKPAGRGRKLNEPPVKLFAAARGIPVLQPSSLKDPWFIDTLRKLRPELFVVVAFRILPPAVFTIPSFGSINLHASLLPRYRGAAPINWAIIRGEEETGVTTFLLEEGVDTGRILLQERLAIGPEETAGELYERLADLGSGVVLETVRLIASKGAAPREQDESLATTAPKIFRDDCRIDWSAGTRRVHDFIRGLSPRPGAFFHHGGTLFKVYRSSVAGAAAADPAPAGTVVSAEGRLLVSCGDGTLSLTELQQEGKNPLPADEFLRGVRLAAGEVFN
jgi:methionyl-tRNA formyltransferase